MAGINKWFRNNYTSVIIWALAIVPILVSLISTIHVVNFFELSNYSWLAVTLAVAFEIGALSSLAALAVMDKISKFSLWIIFILITIMQMMGNTYYAFDFITAKMHTDPQWTMNWIDLFSIQSADIPTTKRILAIVSGAILPVVSLSFLHLLINYITKTKEEEEYYAQYYDDEGNYMGDDYYEEDVDPEDEEEFEPNDELKKAAEEYKGYTKTTDVDESGNVIETTDVHWEAEGKKVAPGGTYSRAEGHGKKKVNTIEKVTLTPSDERIIETLYEDGLEPNHIGDNIQPNNHFEQPKTDEEVIKEMVEKVPEKKAQKEIQKNSSKIAQVNKPIINKETGQVNLKYEPDMKNIEKEFNYTPTTHEPQITTAHGKAPEESEIPKKKEVSDETQTPKKKDTTHIKEGKEISNKKEVKSPRPNPQPAPQGSSKEDVIQTKPTKKRILLYKDQEKNLYDGYDSE